MCCPPSFGEGVEAPFVCALLLAHGKPALRTNQLRANAAASTASHPAFVTTAKRPSCRERTGRAGRNRSGYGESEMFFAKGLDDPNQIEIIAINRSGRKSLIARSGRIAAKKQPVLGTLARQGGDKSESCARSFQIPILTVDGNSEQTATVKFQLAQNHYRRNGGGEGAKALQWANRNESHWTVCPACTVVPLLRFEQTALIGPSVSPH